LKATTAYFIERPARGKEPKRWLSYGLGWTTQFNGTQQLPHSGAKPFKSFTEAATMKAKPASQSLKSDRIKEYPLPPALRNNKYFTPVAPGSFWQVAGEPPRARRAMQIGEQVGLVGLPHSGGYEVWLRFADGKMDSFNPHELFPAPQLKTMKAKHVQLDPEVIDILARKVIITGNQVKMPPLDRKLYERVNKALELLGGKWLRSAKAHVFESDPSNVIGLALNNGTVLDEKKTYQFFPTPPDLARRMAVLLGVVPTDQVLEPSAGHGALLDALVALGVEATQLCCCELNPNNQAVLRRKGYTKILADDFLTLSDMNGRRRTRPNAGRWPCCQSCIPKFARCPPRAWPTPSGPSIKCVRKARARRRPAS
jgi:hypothetical protein